MLITKRSLGKNQEFILGRIRRHGCWYPGCGWIWSSRGETIRLLDTLVGRGLATKSGILNPEYRPVGVKQ